MRLILIVIGFLLLVAGGQVPTLFAASAAFLGTIELLPRIGLQFQVGITGDWSILLISFTAALVILVLVYFLGRLPLYLLAAANGAYLVNLIPTSLGISIDWISWQLQAVLALLAVALFFYSFNFGLLLLTTLTGSALVVRYLPLEGISPLAVFLVLIIFGSVAQFLLLQYAPTPESNHPKELL